MTIRQPKFLRNTSALVARLFANEDGNITALTGFVGTAVFICAGAAVDYRQALATKSVLQTAADSAVLGALKAKGLNDEQRAQRAQVIFAANTQNDAVARSTTPTITVSGGGASVTAEVNFPTSVLKVIGFQSIPVKAVSAGLGKGKKIEMAMMTDITGSMSETRNGQSKMEGLKLAAKDMLDIVLPGVPSDDFRVALIPFANYVNAGSRAEAVTGLNPTRNNGGSTEYLITCVTERTGSQAYTDATPGPSAWIGSTAPGNSSNNYDANGGCDRSGGGSGFMPEVMPLTSDKAALMAQIDAFTPAGSTAGHLGTAWAWYALSPSWNSIWNLSTPPAAYSNQEYMKVAVLMTDGEYNTQYAATDSKTQALATCNAMKAAGIKIFTVGFGFDPNNTGDDAARDLLTQCASGTGHYYFPYDGDALRQTFQQIGDQVNAIGNKVTLSQ